VVVGVIGGGYIDVQRNEIATAGCQFSKVAHAIGQKIERTSSAFLIHTLLNFTHKTRVEDLKSNDDDEKRR